MSSFWFDAMYSTLHQIRPESGDKFVLHPTSPFAVVVRKGLVVGFCLTSRVGGEDAVLGRAGIDTLARL